MRKKKLAFVFSGAAARIAQQAVMMRYLVQGKAFKDGKTLVPTVLAGASSGAISIVALNAILLTEGLVEGGELKERFSWSDYEQIIGSINRKDVYNAGGVLRSALEFVGDGAIFDTTPLRELLEETLEKRIGFHTLGDLPVRSYISVVEQETGKIHRLSSVDHPDLPLVDVVMASAAIPILFPPVELMLPGKSDTAACVDGGTGIDMIPVDAIHRDRYDRVILIRPQPYDPEKKWFKDPPFSDVRIVKHTINNFMFIEEALMDYAFHRAVWHDGGRVYCYVPDLECNHSPLDFESGSEQLQKTEEWAGSDQNRPKLVKNCI